MQVVRELAGEEASGTNTFDGRGGSAVAVFDNAAWILPKLGHLSWENAVVRPARIPGRSLVRLTT